MYVVSIPNRGSPPAILLRESYREGGKVRNRTLANLTHWPRDKVEALRQVLRGGGVGGGGALEDGFEIERSRPHGHVMATLGTLRRLKLDKLIGSKPSRQRQACLAMIVARILEPASKLATASSLDPATLHSTLGEVLGIDSADEDELYTAMDWLLKRQRRIEAALARRHLGEGSLVLYDLTSTYFEGRHCPLARLGYSRDNGKGKLQIEFGVLTDAQGCPVAVEVFEGSVGDPKTLAPQIEKLRDRFGLKEIVLVGDRGMITAARIREDLRPLEGLAWITALRAPEIRGLMQRGTLQLSLFDEKDLAEIVDPAFPGERLVACRNPLLGAERARKREDLLRATERELAKIATATTRPKRRLRDPKKIAFRVGKLLGRFKVGKHFRWEITEEGLRYERDQDHIAQEAVLDGIYVIRTSASAKRLDAHQTVLSYKKLSTIERAFRSYKTVDLHVRPIHHRKEDRVRAHVLLCMLAYYVEWHMRRALAPLLFDDDDKKTAAALRRSVVAPAQRSPRALAKIARKRTEDGLPARSFQTLLKDLRTIVKSRVRPKLGSTPAFDKITTPTPIQQRAFDLLQVSLRM
jgi:transposase